jgi:hypothetical protein
MKEIFLQLRYLENYNGLALIPDSYEDLEALNEYQPNQIIKAKISAIRKQRSYKQLRAYFACCKTVAENTENTNFNSKNKVDLQLRIKLGWIKETILVNGTIQFIPRSISYKEMKHLEACRYFDRAFETMAKFLGISVEELIKNSDI